jgi:hypothetical protein
MMTLSVDSQICTGKSYQGYLRILNFAHHGSSLPPSLTGNDGQEIKIGENTGMVSSAVICSAVDMDVLITDDGISHEAIQCFTDSGVKIVVGWPSFLDFSNHLRTSANGRARLYRLRKNPVS